jgi:hypothetical protein
MRERQSRVLLTRLTECVSSTGRTYLRGWAGANNLLGFEADEPDEQGRRIWDLFLVERAPQRSLPLPVYRQGAETLPEAPRKPRSCGAIE